MLPLRSTARGMIVVLAVLLRASVSAASSCGAASAAATGVHAELAQEADTAKLCLLQKDAGGLHQRRSALEAVAAVQNAEQAAAVARTATATAKPAAAARPTENGDAGVALAHVGEAATTTTAAQVTGPSPEKKGAEAAPAALAIAGDAADSVPTAKKETLRRFPLALGMIDGSELHYATEVSDPSDPAFVQQSKSVGPTVHERNKVALMIIDLCPVCWIIGIDRLYLGDIKLGIAKLALCLATRGYAGVLWGMIDFIAVMSNALSKATTLDSVGMHARFSADQVQASFWLGLADIVMVFVSTYAWYQRHKRLKAEALRENAMNGRHYGAKQGKVQGGS